MRFRHTILCLAVILSCLTHGSDTAQAQSPALLEAYNRYVTLYQQGKYSEAISYAAKALKLGEEELGPDHPITARLLNNLALLYHAQGNYAEAAPLYRRSLAI
ncbi:MAG: tetratricopeptide repeat protein, partial [Paracoccaceae bacterium]